MEKDKKPSTLSAVFVAILVLLVFDDSYSYSFHASARRLPVPSEEEESTRRSLLSNGLAITPAMG